MAGHPKKAPEHEKGPFRLPSHVWSVRRMTLLGLGFFFWELCPELNIRPRGRMATDAFFKHIKSLKAKSKNSDNGQINI